MKMKGASDAEAAEGAAMEFFMARQPIFNRNLDILAYELLFRQCQGDRCAVITDFDDATNSIIADGFFLASKGLCKGERLSINVGYDNILSGYVLALPADRVILEIPGDIELTDEFLAACRALKARGYCLLLDNCPVERSGRLDELARLADLVKVPVGATAGREVARLKRSLAGWPGKVIASRIENWESFEGCRSLGFDYFQGYFFSKPQELVGRKISSHKAVRMKLLRELSGDDAGLSRIVELISMDQALAVRLLRFVNSASNAPRQRVDTLSRAASVVGLDAIRKWAMAAVLSDLDSSGKGQEISYRTMHGAFFLTGLAEKGFAPGQDPGTLFLLGLLRNVDSLMGVSMGDILEGMPLDPSVKCALLRDASEPLARFVILLDMVGDDRWGPAQSFFRQSNIPLVAAARLFMSAGDRAREMLTAAQA